MIDSIGKLKVHLKLFKKQLAKQGCGDFQYFPLFCSYYENNKEKYQLPVWDVMNTACEILVEED